MMKNLGKVALLASLGFAGQMLATEFRAPIATTNGPLYYSFDKLHKKKSNFTTWSVGEAREANEAYIKHSSKSQPLSTLFFGKDEFTIGESFQNANAFEHGLTENYNPYLDLTRLAPRVSYSERGVIWGAAWDYPVWKNKGRIGIRASVPFKYIKLERDEQTEDAYLGQQEHVIRKDSRFVKPFIDGSGASKTVELKNVYSYRMNLVKNLLYRDSSGVVYSVLRYNPTTKNMYLGNAAYGLAASGIKNYGSEVTSAQIPFVVIKGNYGEKAPYNQGGALLLYNTDGKTLNTQSEAGASINYPVSTAHSYQSPLKGSELIALTNTADPGADRAGVFVNGTDYSTPDQSNDLWLTTVNGGNDGDFTGVSKTGVDFIEQHLARYHFDVTDWLQDRGFEMKTNEETSFGDITAEVFYEHCFNDSWRGELELGVKIPTGNGGSDYSDSMYNAYRVQMGNGSHWEIKLGGLVAWQALDWMNVKLDAAVNFAIEDTEQRCAAYKGATIKNFGPRADAEVSWTSFVGNLDFNFTHPKTKKIKGMIGYQFYYKTEDDIDFKNSTAATWLGKVWSLADGVTAAPINPADGEQTPSVRGTQWSTKPLEMELSSHVAEMNTEQMAHRLRMEGAYSLSKYLTVAVGGLYTFAGQNIPAEADIHAGCNVRF